MTPSTPHDSLDTTPRTQDFITSSSSLQFQSIFHTTLSAPQDYYDPETENTLEESFNGAAAAKRSVLEEGSAKVGTKVDLFCTKNRVYYEAAIKQIRKPRRAGEATRLLFHFLGWSSCFDEWVPIDRLVGDIQR